MGCRRRLQLLKPNYIPIDCTAEVLQDGLHLLRINGKLLFRFGYDKIQGVSCPTADNLEMEVHMGNGKMGKVKLQSPGPHVMGPSPVQALQEDLQAAMERMKKGSIKGGEREGGGGEGAVSPLHERKSSVVIHDERVVPSSPPTPSSRRSTADSVASDATSTLSSSGTWGPGRRGPDGSAANVRLTGSVKMHGSPTLYDPNERGVESREEEDTREAGAQDAEEVEEEVETKSVAELRRSWDVGAGGGTSRGGRWEEKVGEGEDESGRPRRSSHGSKGTVTSRPAAAEPKFHTMRGHLSLPVREEAVRVTTSGGTEGGASYERYVGGAPAIPKAKPAGASRNSGTAAASMGVEDLQREVATARDLAGRRLTALNKAIGERERLETEVAELRAHGADHEQLLQYQKAVADGQEDVQALRVELTEAQGLADEYAQALGQSRTELSLLKEARAKAQGEAEEAHHMMKDLQQRLVKVEQQAKEAEDCAREADAACVAANEARAALRGQLETANEEIVRLKQAGDSSNSADSQHKVELLREELRSMDQAAGRAVERAKSEAARASSLQAELDALRAEMTPNKLQQSYQQRGGGEEEEHMEQLQAGLAEMSGRAREYLAALREKEREAQELRALLADGSEQRKEVEAARNAALAQAQSAHDDAVRAYRQADNVAAELRALQDRLARREAADAEEEANGEELRTRLMTAQRESRHHQAAAHVAEEALAQAHSEVQQATSRAKRAREEAEGMAQRADALAAQLSEAREESADAREEAAGLRRRMEDADGQVAKAEAMAKRAEERAAAAEEAANQVEGLIQRLEGLGSALEEERRAGMEVAGEVGRLRAALRRAEEEVERAAEDAAVQRERAEEAAEAEAAAEAERAEVARLRGMLAEATSAVRSAEKTQAGLENRIKELEWKLHRASEEAHAYKGDAEEARRELAALQSYAAEADSRSAELEEEMDRLGRQLQARRMSRASATTPPAAPSSPNSRQHNSSFYDSEGEGQPLHDNSALWQSHHYPIQHHQQQQQRSTPLVSALSASFHGDDKSTGRGEGARQASLRVEQIRRLEALEAKFAAHTSTRPRASELHRPTAASSAGGAGSNARSLADEDDRSSVDSEQTNSSYGPATMSRRSTSSPRSSPPLSPASNAHRAHRGRQ